MQNLPAGVAFTVTVPFQNAQGVAVQPTGIIVSVLDEDGRLLHGPEIPTVALEESELSYRVPADVAALKPGVAVGVRTVEVEFTTADGLIEVRQSVMVRAGLRLRYLVNSFASYERLMMSAADLPRIDAFNAAERAQQEPALIEAFTRLTRFGYRVTPAGFDENDEVDYDRITDFGTGFGCAWHISPRTWQALTAEDFEKFDTFNPDFRASLYRAQVQEANAILTTDTVEEIRASGLLSKSTGESSAMFRSSKPLELGVSKEALAHLTGYIEIRGRLSRS